MLRCIFPYIYIYIYICVCVYVCVCVGIKPSQIKMHPSEISIRAIGSKFPDLENNSNSILFETVWLFYGVYMLIFIHTSVDMTELTWKYNQNYTKKERKKEKKRKKEM